MTTVMEEKLIAAGVRVPTQVERIWRVLRDNPAGLTALRVAAITGISNSSTLLSMMVKRKMASVRSESQRRPIHGGVMAGRPINIYTTDMKDYEMLPAPQKDKPAPAKAPVLLAPAVEKKPAAPELHRPLRKPPTVSEAQAFVERMTIAEARAVWAVLDRMFGGSE